MVLDNSQETKEDQYFDINIVKTKVKDILITTLSGVLPQMRPIEEVLNSVFYVIGKESIESLDNVGLFINRAFTNLYRNKVTIVDKFVAFNLLVTKYEAYLKKLYYLMHNSDVPAQNEGEDVTWKNVIYAHRCLWNLKFSTDTTKQQLYQYLMLIKGWRNDESHISPTASEQEVNTAINIVISMYFYATGASITDLEMAGHDVDKVNVVDTGAAHFELPRHNPELYSNNNDEGYANMAAESVDIRTLPEEKKIEVLKKSIIKLLGYNPKKSAFTKQHHWEAIYRIAADKGFIIDGDYAYFKRIIDDMQISNLPTNLTINVLEHLNQGIYAKNIEDWSSENLDGKRLQKYNDIKQCADAFSKVINENISKVKN